MQWLYQARKRYGLAILNYMVTSNHIHLLVVDTGKKDVISKSMQLVAGRTGQEYNQRKNRRGAYWEDRYHATAVESGEGYQLRERSVHYKALFGAEKDDIGIENTYFWDVKVE